ncbi:unnamed protein product [Ixodes pacificus]
MSSSVDPALVDSPSFMRNHPLDNAWWSVEMTIVEPLVPQEQLNVRNVRGAYWNADALKSSAW